MVLELLLELIAMPVVGHLVVILVFINGMVPHGFNLVQTLMVKRQVIYLDGQLV